MIFFYLYLLGRRGHNSCLLLFGLVYTKESGTIYYPSPWLFKCLMVLQIWRMQYVGTQNKYWLLNNIIYILH